jgi:long-chain acyl-CoA synthetase
VTVRHPRDAADVLADVEGQTVPQLFARTVAERPHAAAHHWRANDTGEWATVTWGTYADQACRLAAAFGQLGLQRGERVALMMQNRPEFHPTDMAVYLAGGTAFSIYNSSSVEQVAHQLQHSAAAIVVVGEPELAAVVEQARAGVPTLRQVIVIDEPATITNPVWHWAELLDTPPAELHEVSAAARPDDVATFIYTSGTTGPPKAVMLTHRNLCVVLDAFVALFGIDLAGRRLVSYLPMAHIAERLMTHYLPARTGIVAHLVDDPSLIPADLPSVRPEVFFGPPRVFEKLHSTLRRSLGDDPGDDPATHRRALAAVGLGDCQIAFTGAAPPPADVLAYFARLGLPVAETYGLSESTGLVAADFGEHRPGLVGGPIPGAEVRLLDDGEILTRGPAVFSGYHRDPERTADVLDADGWLHTGDLAVIDDGALRIVDRKKELLITSGGKNVSPANIERSLKELPLIGQACVVGDGRPHLAALLVLDVDAAAAWATERGCSDLSTDDLVAHPDLLAEVSAGVDAVNAAVSRPERVKRFLVLADEWLADTDLLTPTMKLKRRGIADVYEAEIEALYIDA